MPIDPTSLDMDEVSYQQSVDSSSKKKRGSYEILITKFIEAVAIKEGRGVP